METGILNVATSRMTRSALLQRAKRLLPAKQMTVQTARTTVAQRYCDQKSSGSQLAQLPRLEPKFWTKQVTKPTAFMPVFRTHPR